MLNRIVAKIVANPLMRAYVLAMLRLLLAAGAAWLAQRGYVQADVAQQIGALTLGGVAAALGVSDVNTVDAKITAAFQLPTDATAADVEKVKQL